MNSSSFFKCFQIIEKADKELATHAAIEDGIEIISDHELVVPEVCYGFNFLINHQDKKAVMLACAIWERKKEVTRASFDIHGRDVSIEDVPASLSFIDEFRGYSLAVTVGNGEHDTAVLYVCWMIMYYHLSILIPIRMKSWISFIYF